MGTDGLGWMDWDGEWMGTDGLGWRDGDGWIGTDGRGIWRDGWMGNEEERRWMDGRLGMQGREQDGGPGNAEGAAQHPHTAPHLRPPTAPPKPSDCSTVRAGGFLSFFSFF